MLGPGVPSCLGGRGCVLDAREQAGERVIGAVAPGCLPTGRLHAGRCC